MAESKANWPKKGLAGQVHAAKRTAPEWATDFHIMQVGYVAWKERRDVREIWDEVLEGREEIDQARARANGGGGGD